MKNIGNKKNILIVSQFYIPDITAAAYRINDMYESIKNMAEIDIITSYPHKSNVIVKEEESNIYRVNINSKSNNKIIRYLNEYFGFMLKSIFISKKLKKKYDYIFVTSPPIFTLVSGYLLARSKKAKLMIDIRDLWPDVLLDNCTLNERSLIYKILKKFEIFMYKKAYLITCVSKYMKQFIENLSGRNAIVIYNGVSESTIIPSEVHRVGEKKLTLFYIGNIGYFQHIDVLISCFQQYPQLSEQFDVHIVGGGSEFIKFKEIIEKNKIAGIRFYGPIEKNETNRLAAEKADVLFLNLNNSETLEKTIPSKLFDYLFFNLPMVYGILGEGKEILEGLGCGVFFQWNDENSLYQALMKVHENYPIYLNKSKGNHDFVCNNFNRQKMFCEFWQEQCGVKNQ